MIETAILCVALNVYFEARGEPEQGQYAVAIVTMNRAKGDVKRACSVVLRHKQFSWTSTKTVKVKGGHRLLHTAIPKEREAWERAVEVAENVVKGKVKDFTGGATHFHANTVQPGWRLVMQKVQIIGRHIFYRSA